MDNIKEYINKGGKILMLTSQNILDVKTPNFNEILAQLNSVNKGVGNGQARK